MILLLSLLPLLLLLLLLLLLVLVLVLVVAGKEFCRNVVDEYYYLWSSFRRTPYILECSRFTSLVGIYPEPARQEHVAVLY
jgi:hypothetical protein